MISTTSLSSQQMIDGIVSVSSRHLTKRIQAGVLPWCAGDDHLR
jgi:type VI protein secretion system component VasA